MTRAFAILTFVAALAFAGSPFLSAGFNGFAADQFPVPQVNPPIQPAGYAFSIWGVIYLWLIVGTGFGLVRRGDATDWRAGRPALFLSLAVGSGWIAVAQVSVVAATVMIWVMLLAALVALLRAGENDRWFQVEPVGAYAGWLTAAASVSVGLVLAGYGFLSELAAAWVGLGLALVIAAVTEHLRPDSLTYPAAVIWALVGVIVANLDPVNPAVIGLAAAGIVYLGTRMVRRGRG